MRWTGPSRPPLPRIRTSARSRATRALVLAGAVGAVVVAPVVPSGSDPSAVAAKRGGVKPVRNAVQVQPGLRYGTSGNTVLDVYRRGAARAAPAVLVVHGGGWWGGDKSRTADISRRLARAGFVAFNVNYTLAAVGRPGFPRQLRELRTAMLWIRRHARSFGVNPRRIGALGSSAGGHLVALLALGGPGPRGASPRLRAAVTWSAPFDLSPHDAPLLGQAIEVFLGCGASPCETRRAEASPVTHASPDDPPMLIVNSQAELVPVAHAEEMAFQLSSAEVEHKLWILPGSSHAREYSATALRPSIDYLRRRLR